MSSMLKVGFIGVGRMGSNIAYRLSNQSKKLKLFAWDVNPTNVSNLVQRQPNITGGESLLDTVTNADYIITCLPTSEHVQNTIKECLTVIDHKSSNISYQHPFALNCCWLDCTSGDANISKTIHNDLFSSTTANDKNSHQNQIHFLDCPVSGGPTGALDGNVQCMVGCNDINVYEKCANDVLQHISFNNKRVGGVGAGHCLKSINNLLNVSNLLILSEGLQCLDEYGIDINVALDVINHSSGRSLMSQERYPIHIIDKQYNYGFQLGLMKKDVHHARQLILQMEENSVFKENKVKRISEIVADLLKIAVEKYGASVDYTEAGKIFHDLHPSQGTTRSKS